MMTSRCGCRLSEAQAYLAKKSVTNLINGVIGKLESFDGKSLDLMTGSGAVHIALREPLTTYKQINTGR
jgi:hypothetical protein